MAKRTRHRSTPKKTRRNPNALYWKVGPQIPWKPWRSSPQALKALVKSNNVNLSKLSRPQRASTPKPRKATVAAPPARPPLRVVKAASKPAIVVRAMPARRPSRTGRKGTKRNPPGIEGIGADFAGLGAALSDLGRNPKGFLWLGGGAAGTMVAGGIVGAQLGRVLPEMQPGMARLVNAATYAGTAVLLSRLPRDVTTRRQMLAGGLAVALWELAQPGATAPLVAKLPGIGRMIAPPDARSLARMPALQANPAAQAQAVAATQPWYRAGGKVNPLNWLAGAEEGDPVSVDGIADDDGQVYGLADEDDAAVPMAGSVGAEDDADSMTVSGVGDSAPLMTYLGDLGCPPSGRGNGLTQLVRV